MMTRGKLGRPTAGSVSMCCSARGMEGSQKFLGSTEHPLGYPLVCHNSTGKLLSVFKVNHGKSTISMGHGFNVANC